MSKHLPFVANGEHAKAEPEKNISEQPPAEEDLGGGDICSLEEAPPTEDDRPLR